MQSRAGKQASSRYQPSRRVGGPLTHFRGQRGELVQLGVTGPADAHALRALVLLVAPTSGLQRLLQRQGQLASEQRAELREVFVSAAGGEGTHTTHADR